MNLGLKKIVSWIKAHPKSAVQEVDDAKKRVEARSEEHTSELQSQR